jgi:hypothetical protein
VVVTFTGASAGMTATNGTLVDNGSGSYTLTVWKSVLRAAAKSGA